MKLLETQTALTAIVVLLAGHLVLNFAQTMVTPAWAASTVDCRIVDIRTSDKLAVKMQRLSSSYDALQVKVVDWEERDPIKVKIAP